MDNSLVVFSRAEPRGRRFRSDRLRTIPLSQGAAPQSEKTMLPIARKCYIVLRAIAFSRKDSP